MAVRRLLILLATISLGLAGLVVVAGPAAADGVMTPSTTSVAVGGSLSVDVTGCSLDVEEGSLIRFQSPRVTMVTGVGGAERALNLSGPGSSVAIPGWVDPEAPAELRGVCIETTYDYELGVEATSEVFRYAPVAIDVIPAEAPEARQISLSLDRDTAAGGQLVLAEVAGCSPRDYVNVNIMADTDLALGGAPRTVASSSASVEDGPVTIELLLVDDRNFPIAPLAEGDYVVVASCYVFDGTGYGMWSAEPTWLHVRGTMAVGSMSIDRGVDAGDVVITGDGCTLPVTVRVTGYTYDLDGSPIDETVTPVQEPDGTWTATWSSTAIGFEISVVADCGDPLSDGFRYRAVHWYEDGHSDQWIGRTSPTQSPVGGSIVVHVSGFCDEERSVVQLLGDDDQVLSEGAIVGGSVTMTGKATVTAPPVAGSYRLVAMCGEKPSYPDSITVFSSTPVAPRTPLRRDPVVGWPESGEREDFHGRIGPITLPADSHHGAAAGDESAAAGLGPSALGISVPRPAGDFAITQMSFDLVDEAGNPVSTSDAHLHHLVIANLSSSNPACPSGTFGLPGEIIAAAGAERTALDFGDPYGLVVEGSDSWAGVYELMNMVDEEQTVYLTYDMEIRRDVENVRPVTTYFGSATGCGSFTWTIDGSGSPDRQGHYLTVANDGVLVGAGGHIHNGGTHTELYDDRGRRLCRNELVVGGPDDPENPGTTTTTTHDHGSAATAQATASAQHQQVAGATDTGRSRMDAVADEEVTTTTGVAWPEYPPEMYPDDPPLESITGCRPFEQLRAGERLYFEATYGNDRPRSGVMGIFMLYVWEGGGPDAPPRTPGPRPPVVQPGDTTTTTHGHHPSGPTTPGHPDHPTDPTDPHHPGGPTDPTDPHHPGGPTDPTDPHHPGGPTVPGGSPAPHDPNEHGHLPGAGQPGGVAAGGTTHAHPAAPAHAHHGSPAYAG